MKSLKSQIRNKPWNKFYNKQLKQFDSPIYNRVSIQLRMPPRQWRIELALREDIT